MKRIHQNLSMEQKVQMLTTDFLDRDQTTFVRISPDGLKTDGKIVWVAAEVFDDTDLPIGNRIDTFLGLAIHEGCHVLYTDFSAYTGITSRIVKFISIITGSTPLMNEAWGHSNLMTSCSLARLGEIGGPCCSKGNSYMSFLLPSR